MTADRVGLGWRRAIGAAILADLDRIDVLEVLADDYVEAPRRDVEALIALGRARPLSLHGVTLGLASSLPVEERRLARLARLIARVAPESWSEHLAFVRGGGFEIGHLAAPPRTIGTVEGAIRNLARARRIVGTAPLVENVATLIDPPASTMDEASWVSSIVAGSGCDLLLDLHNLHANAVNFGGSARAMLARLPLARVRTIHLAGGRWIGAPTGGRLLDDHLHAVPDEVFALLVEVAARAPQPLTVIVERDGAYPPSATMLAELERARGALAAGRRRAMHGIAAA